MKAIPARKPAFIVSFPFSAWGKAAAEEDSDETGGTDPTAPAERGTETRCRNPGGDDPAASGPGICSSHCAVYGGRSPVLPEAVRRSAAAVWRRRRWTPVPVVRVPDTRRAMAVLAATFYRHPTRELKLIGVTGTNGKTTTSHLIQTILNDRGTPAGLIGTIHMRIGDRSYPVRNTTPEAVDLQRSFRWMCDEGCRYAVIEASSHALDLGRTRGCEFHAAVFTNLTRDHLDYHGTMEKYREAKGLLFSQLGNRPMGRETGIGAERDDDASAGFARITFSR